MEIILLRHGKTIYNEQRKYTGKTDVDLSQDGVNELTNLKTRVPSIIGYQLYTSSLKRAKQTAHIYYPEVMINNSFIEFDEMDLGDFESHTYDELKDNPLYKNWLDNITTVRCPNGESYLDFKERVTSMFLELITKNEDFCLVAHGGTIQMIMSQIINPNISFFDWRVLNGRGFKISYKNTTFTYEEIL